MNNDPIFGNHPYFELKEKLNSIQKEIDTQIDIVFNNFEEDKLIKASEIKKLSNLIANAGLIEIQVDFFESMKIEDWEDFLKEQKSINNGQIH